MSLLHVNIQEAGYEKEKKIVEAIEFTVEKGELIGLIGANGAGKSTTIKSILGLVEYMNGTISFDGSPYSYIPERPIFYDELTLWEHLDFVAAVEGLSDFQYRAKASKLLETFKLAEHAHQYPTTYSKGMQQKAMLILAMVTNPKVYIIDEPFLGLDPKATKIFLDRIQEERRRGAGILMCTHVLDTAEKVCDRFLLIDNGQLKASGTMDDIRIQCHLPLGSLYDCFHRITDGDSYDK